jgi:hypothetical protein
MSMRMSACIRGEQSAGRVKHDAPPDYVDHRDDHPDEGNEGPFAAGLTKNERIMRGKMLDSLNGADNGAVGQLGTQPCQLVRIPGVLLVGGNLFDHQFDTTQRLCRTPIADLRESHNDSSLMLATTENGQRTGFGGIGGEHLTDGKASDGIVRAHVKDHLTAQRMSPPDAGDDQLLARRRPSVTERAHSVRGQASADERNAKHTRETSAPIDINDVDTNRAVRRQRADNGTQSLRGSPAPADYPAKILRVNADLEKVSTTQQSRGDLNVVRMVNNATNEVL